MNAKQVAKEAVHGNGNFEDFPTHQAAYRFIRRVQRHISGWSDTMYANTSVEKIGGCWRARVSAAYEA
jgi:hypothetical protein